MRFWKRRASLQVGTSRYQLDDLKFSFEVTSEDDAGIPICKLEIYNLAPMLMCHKVTRKNLIDSNPLFHIASPLQWFIPKTGNRYITGDWPEQK